MEAGIAQLGERQTEDLKVACSIHAHRIFYIPIIIFRLWLLGYCGFAHLCTIIAFIPDFYFCEFDALIVGNNLLLFALVA
jgi:hypothetical protein